MELLAKSQQAVLNQLDLVMRECRLCPEVDHSQIYPGIYRPGQKYFFVGAAPWNLAGPEEAFMVGKASENFNMFIKAAGILRSECYTTNAVVHIPVTNQQKSRQPNIAEIKNCSKYLKLQLDIIKPKIVIALGTVAINALDSVEPHTIFSVSRAIRKPHKWNGSTLFVCTHPSPMAVSFRGVDEQVEDYKAVKRYYETFLK